MGATSGASSHLTRIAIFHGNSFMSQTCKQVAEDGDIQSRLLDQSDESKQQANARIITN